MAPRARPSDARRQPRISKVWFGENCSNESDEIGRCCGPVEALPRAGRAVAAGRPRRCRGPVEPLPPAGRGIVAASDRTDRLARGLGARLRFGRGRAPVSEHPFPNRDAPDRVGGSVHARGAPTTNRHLGSPVREECPPADVPGARPRLDGRSRFHSVLQCFSPNHDAPRRGWRPVYAHRSPAAKRASRRSGLAKTAAMKGWDRAPADRGPWLRGPARLGRPACGTRRLAARRRAAGFASILSPTGPARTEVGDRCTARGAPTTNRRFAGPVREECHPTPAGDRPRPDGRSRLIRCCSFRQTTTPQREVGDRCTPTDHRPPTPQFDGPIWRIGASRVPHWRPFIRNPPGAKRTPILAPRRPGAPVVGWMAV